ncbi:MAG TPA: nucleoside kinase [Candidatus Cloacimonetes bacterium]|nr:nucleoside kinase [Candidatus Cloacimonadota bacterium]HEX38148.1 nucleoside kinase [Candidatus Cloacimonadota bacterium]
MEIKIIKNGSVQKTCSFDKEITPLLLMKSEGLTFNCCVVAAKINKKLYPLDYTIKTDCEIEFLHVGTREGMRIYQNSLIFVFVRTVDELFENPKIEVKHSLGDGCYIETYSRFLLTAGDVEKIKKRMNLHISNDEPFEPHFISTHRAISYFEGNIDKQQLLKYYPNKNILIYKFGELYDFYNGPLVPSSGYLKLFDLKYLPPGLILRFPSVDHPHKIGTFHPLPNLLNIFTEYERWGNILGLSNVASLNKKIENFEINEIIQVSEALHEKKIAEIAEDIYQKRNSGIIVLIAGPSASGKTTFMKRLAIQLKVNGLRSFFISLDNYFLDREKTPLDDYGEFDFESIHALDKELINDHIKKLMAGEEVEIPKYNFIAGKREHHGTKFRLHEDQVILIEGIHGLNNILTQSIQEQNKYKIYVSALTQINLDNHNRISTSDTRIIRRIVRDTFFRGYNAEQTIKRWYSIRAGERKFVFTFQEEADAMFNSALVYELGVLRRLALPELKKIPSTSDQYSEAQRLITLLSFFEPIPENSIPRNSILREFIKGSDFEY